MIRAVSKHILCPVDLGSQTSAVLEWASCLAKVFKSRVTIINDKMVGRIRKNLESEGTIPAVTHTRGPDGKLRRRKRINRSKKKA